MWKIRCIFVRKYYPVIISPCFLETLGNTWWVHSLLMCFFHLQGIPILWKVLKYSNPGYSWTHEARASISLEHLLSAERASGQVDLWLRHSHACLLHFYLASCTLASKVWCSRSGPRGAASSQGERSDPASWAFGVKFFFWMCVNILIKIHLAVPLSLWCLSVDSVWLTYLTFSPSKCR